MSRKQGTPPCDHKVEENDNFSKLAAVYYGDGSNEKAKKIQDANPKVLPNELKIGQLIKIPA